MFHLRDGWFFEREEEGCVHIVKKANSCDDAPIVAEIHVSAWEWASIIAAVSPEGETSETWRQARDFHGGE